MGRVTAVCVVITTVTCGCTTAYHASQVRDGSLGYGRIKHLQALAERRHGSADPAVLEAILDAMTDSRPAVRYYAAAAIGNHIPSDKEAQLRAWRALTLLLHDDVCGCYCQGELVLFPLMVVDVLDRTGSVRSQALLQLTLLTGRDFGFDQAKWERYFQERSRRNENPE